MLRRLRWRPGAQLRPRRRLGRPLAGLVRRLRHADVRLLPDPVGLGQPGPGQVLRAGAWRSRSAFNTGAMVGQQRTPARSSARAAAWAERDLAVQRVSETVGEMVEQMGLTDEVSVGMRREGLVITLSGSLLFESGKADLRPESAEILLARLANLARADPGKIRIEGHTDNIPIADRRLPVELGALVLPRGRGAALPHRDGRAPADRFEVGRLRRISPARAERHAREPGQESTCRDRSDGRARRRRRASARRRAAGAGS